MSDDTEPDVVVLPGWVGILIVASAMVCICYCASSMFKKSGLSRGYKRSVRATQDGIETDLLAAVDPRCLSKRFRRMTGQRQLIAQRRSGGLGVRGAMNSLRRKIGSRIVSHAALPGVPLPIMLVACTDTNVADVPVDAHG